MILLLVLSIIVLLIFLFLIMNSIIWMKNKKITNINDIIIQYTIYINFILLIFILIFLSYLYYYDLRLIIVK
jgi:hypothetical protein